MTDFKKTPLQVEGGILSEGIGSKKFQSASLVAGEVEMLEATYLENASFLESKFPLGYKGHQFRDDFVLLAGVYGTIWDLTTVVGAGTNAIKAGAGVGGVSLLTTGASADDLECTQSTDDFFSRAIVPMAEIEINLTADLTGKIVKFGLSDNPMVEDGDYAGFLFHFTDDPVNWWSTSGDGTDASLAVGPTAGTPQKLRLHLTAAGVLYLFIDNILVGTVTGAVTADTAMYLFYGVKAIGAAAEIIEVNHINAAWGF